MAHSAEDFPHHADQAQSARIADAVKNAIGVLAGCKNALVAQNRQMLGYVALGSTYMFDNILNADFPIAQGAKYFKPERM